MKLYHLSSGPLRENAYFLVGEGNNAVLIDGGENYNLIKKTEEKYGFKVKALLLTHAHFDHCGNAEKLRRDGATVYISEKDGIKLAAGDTLGDRFGRTVEPVTDYKNVYDGEILELFGIKIKVIATPGHTDGSVTFAVDNMLFTGDTLFLESVGRTDFPTGSRDDLVSSVKKLFALEGDYDVFPGHQEFTTLSHEREYNDFNDYD